MSGSFDFPPASDRALVASRGFHRYQDRRHSSPTVGSTNLSSSRFDVMNDPRSTAAEIQEAVRRRNRRLAPAAQAPTSAVRSHFRAAPRGRFPLGSRYRRWGGDVARAPPGNGQDAADRLNATSRDILMSNTFPTARIGVEDIGTGSHLDEVEANEAYRKRFKRRRLDQGQPVKRFGPVYGYRGQVVAGPLKMELEFCDGGLHEDSEAHKQPHWPENVLRNDWNVYCSRRSKCHLILRHQGETAFCIQRLIIKAPGSGFTAPIQEGLIFIAMENDELVSRASCYQVQESPIPSPCVHNAWHPLVDSDFAEGFDPERPAPHRVNAQGQRFTPHSLSNTMAYTSLRQRRLAVPASVSEWDTVFHNLSDLPKPVDAVTGLGMHSGFNVTTDYEKHSDDDEELPSPQILADRNRRGFPVQSVDFVEENDDAIPGHFADSQSRIDRFHPPQRRSQPRTTPSRIRVLAPHIYGTDRGHSSLLKPHARFFIERGKVMVNVHFDPPVSGRYILLKLWSPAKEQNIDIKSIVTMGWAGPRFFPASQPM